MLAPVLLVAGDHDILFCGLLLSCTNPEVVRAHETPYFASAAGMDVHLVPDTGHNLTLHPSAQGSFDVIDAWLDART